MYMQPKGQEGTSQPNEVLRDGTKIEGRFGLVFMLGFDISNQSPAAHVTQDLRNGECHQQAHIEKVECVLLNSLAKF